MPSRKRKAKLIPVWLRIIGAVICVALIWLYWFTTHLTSISIQHDSRDVVDVARQAVASNWQIQSDLLAVSFDFPLGGFPSMSELVWRPADQNALRLDLQASAPNLWSIAVNSDVTPTPCSVTAVQRLRDTLKATLTCDQVNVDWSAYLISTAHGQALRWRMQSFQKASEVEISMLLPGAAVEGAVDGSPIVARRHPKGMMIPAKAEASSYDKGHGPERIVDGDSNTEWFAERDSEEAWVVLDLQGEWTIASISFQWWAVSMADDWLLESRRDSSERWVLKASGSGAIVKSGSPHSSGEPPAMNPVVQLHGWSGTTRALRLTMRHGHKDPWGFGVLFGLRSFDVMGSRAGTLHGPAKLWGDRPGSPGIWFALEHPRAHCVILDEKEDVRKSRCKLQLDRHAGMDITGSIGFFEDGEYTQLRRAFSSYLEVARGNVFGQNLHYNSWYDLRSAPCADGSADGSRNHGCRSHLMNKDSCLERLEQFNANLSKRGGPALDGFLLDDGWDNWDSLWEIDEKRFQGGFDPLLRKAKSWGTKLGVWMSPFGGYMIAGSRRLAYGRAHGFEITSRGTFALSGPKYYGTFKRKVEQRLSEGFGLFKFDGMGGGLGQKGGDAFLSDFEAVLRLVRSMKPVDFARQHPTEQTKNRPWVSLTIGTWPSPFWLLWADSIWRDGPDVGMEGEGSPRERWLTFRDHALRQALERGPLFPMTAFMQHGIVWSRSAETDDIWRSDRSSSFEDFCIEVMSFFLSGTGLQELYVQLELMEPQHWDFLAEVASLARREASVLKDAHPIGGNPIQGDIYGVASFQGASTFVPPRGYIWWRNPASTAKFATFNLASVLELPDAVIVDQSLGGMVCWEFHPLHPTAIHPHLTGTPSIEYYPEGSGSAVAACPCTGNRGVSMPKLWGPREGLRVRLEPFSFHAWHLVGSTCK